MNSREFVNLRLIQAGIHASKDEVEYYTQALPGLEKMIVALYAPSIRATSSALTFTATNAAPQRRR